MTATGSTPPTCLPKHQRVEWIDTLKVLTMLLVVMGHCTYYVIKTNFGGIEYIPLGEVSLSYKALEFLTNVIYRFHMPLFMAVSGACFSWNIRRFSNLKELIRNKSSRLLLPFLMVTTFVAVPLKYTAGYYEDSKSVILDIICGQYLLLGNSHLWFVVSLFYIFVAFYCIEKLNIRYNWKYWGFLLILSWMGILFLRFSEFMGEAFGISGMLKYLLFFAIGFSTFDYWNSKTSVTYIKQILSWLGFVGAVLGVTILPKYAGSIIFKVVLQFPINTILAVWGCVNMIYLAKSVCQWEKLRKTKLYQFFNKYTYELYLYSDPFNYLFIASFVPLFGQDLFIGEYPIYAYGIRFFGTILAATVIIIVKNKISSLAFHSKVV